MQFRENIAACVDIAERAGCRRLNAAYGRRLPGADPAEVGQVVPELDGIVERYGMRPQIEFYEVFALTDNAHGKVELFREDVPAK